MARARNIKPGFFINDELAEIDPLGRLLFVGLWTIADREGRLEYRPARIKVETLPYDNCDIEKLLEELEKRQFILTYFHEGSRYIQITNFTKHQNPHRNEKPSEIPAPEDVEKLLDNSCTTPEITGAVQEKHTTNRADSFNMIPDSGSPQHDSFNPESDTTTESEQDDVEDEYRSKNEKPNQTRKQSIKKIADLFTKVFAGAPNQVQMQMMESFIKDGLSEWHVIRALEIAGENGAKHPGYIKPILTDWLHKKAFTKEQVEQLEQTQFRKGKGRASPRTRDEFTYTTPRKPRPGEFLFLDDESDNDEEEPVKVADG